MKEFDQIPDYVFACLRKDATKQELEQLERWMREDDHASLYRQLQQIDQISSDLKLYHSFDLTTARQKC
jgi:ferric-dicitrate binding protein FerR (iron transport regulator)